METKTVKLDKKTSLEIVTSKDFKDYIVIDVSWNKKDIEKLFTNWQGDFKRIIFEKILELIFLFSNIINTLLKLTSLPFGSFCRCRLQRIAMLG